MESNIQKKITITDAIKSKGILLVLALICILSNTQKLSYTYFHQSFDFSVLNSTWDYVCYNMAWAMVIITIITIELSILVFVSRGKQWIGILFAIIIFILNVDYYTDVAIFENPLSWKIGRELLRVFLLSFLPPAVVYTFSEIYVRAYNEEQLLIDAASQENNKATIQQIQEEKEQVESKLIELQLILKQVQEEKEQVESKVTNVLATKEQVQEEKKQVESKYQHLSLVLEQVQQDKNQLQIKWNEYEHQRTCSVCGTIFDTVNQRVGHQKGKCKPLDS